MASAKTALASARKDGTENTARYVSRLHFSPPVIIEMKKEILF
jgi:hypothetical protein